METSVQWGLIATSIFAGLFWGAIVGGIYRWAGRGIPNVKEKSFGWVAGTAIFIAIGFYGYRSGDHARQRRPYTILNAEHLAL
jgi:hypothetical protein